MDAESRDSPGPAAVDRAYRRYLTAWYRFHGTQLGCRHALGSGPDAATSARLER